MQKSKMGKVLEDILKMGYHENRAAASGLVHNEANHEKAVEDVLLQHGLTKSEISKVSKRHRDELLRTREYPEMEDNSYIPQPCGKQDSPDFLVKSEGRLCFIECKSVGNKTTAPVYNSAVPKSGYIYVFCCKKYDETTIYLGQDLVSSEVSRRLHEHIERARKEDKKINKLLKNLPNNTHGIDYYTRPMIGHKGGQAINDYFKHPRRNELEQSALNYV